MRPGEHGAVCGTGGLSSATCTSANTGNEGTAPAGVPSRRLAVRISGVPLVEHEAARSG